MSAFLKYLNDLIHNLNREDYDIYKEELKKLINIKDDEFSKLVEVFKAYNKNKIFLSYLLFIHYEKWIFPSISVNNIICYDNISFSSKILFILKKGKNFSLDDKTFILWYFYLFYLLFCEKYKTNNSIMNYIRYLLLETNKVVSTLYENKNIKINNLINILDTYLMLLKYFSNSSKYQELSSQKQKIKKKIILKKYFDLLEKISIISLKSNDYTDFEVILNYLEIISNNSELNDEINILLLFTNNSIQDFINNLLQNIDIVIAEKNIPQYKNKLINFYTHFLNNKYKISNLFSNCIDVTRKSFEHLYNFKYNKNLIIKDISKNNFNSTLLSELLKNEKEKTTGQNNQYLLTPFFLFDHNIHSIISFEHNNILLDKVILFFSFQIGKYGVKNINEFPLIIIKNKETNNNNKKISNKNKNGNDYNLFLKIYLTKINENDEKYHLCLSQPNYESVNIINDVDYYTIDSNNIYYFAFYIHDKKIKTYLYYERYKKNNDSNILYREYEFSNMKNKNNVKFIIGNDEEKSFYKGKIGPIIMIEAPSNKDIITKDIDSLISNIILLKDKYKDFIIIKSNLSKYYNFDLADYYDQKEVNDIIEIFEKNRDEKIELKNEFKCLLYLNPNSFNYLEFNDNSKALPVISEYCNNNSEYKLLEIYVSIIYYENIKKLFAMDNGFNFICLQIEYYNQFAQYFLLKNNKRDIFNETELNIIIKEIIRSLKANILLLLYHCDSKYLYDSYKKVFLSFYNCLLSLNKIMPIMKDIFDDLVILMKIYRGNALTTINCVMNGNEFNENNLVQQENNNYIDNKIIVENINIQYKHFLDINISYYIGIIEILLDSDFYDNNQTINNFKLIKNLFKFLLSCFENNEDNKNFVKFININLYINIFYKLLNFISLLNKYFNNNKEDNNKPNNEKKKEFEDLLKLDFKLLINILNDNKEDDEYFHKIFRFVFKNNRNNPYIVYSYLSEINEFSKKNLLYFLEEKEINQLEKYLYELNNNNECDEEKKIKNLIIILILELACSFPQKSSNNLNNIENYLKKNEISNDLFPNLTSTIEKYLTNIISNNVNNSIIKNLNYQELMKYAWDLFKFLISTLRYIKSKKSKYNENEFKMNIYSILSIFSFIEKEIGEIDLSNINHSLFIYLINYVKFIYFILNDIELNFLFNDTLFLYLIDSCFNNCFQSTLFHCNIYININEKDNIDNKESKKLISQIFLDLYMTHLERIYNKYSNEDNKKEISDEDYNFLKNLSKNIEKNYLREFIFSNYNLKKLTDYDTINSNFFLSDFLKLLLSEKKYLKKFDKKEGLSPIIKRYKTMKEIILDIEKNNKDNLKDNNSFDFYFTSYYFFEIYQWSNNIKLYLQNKAILSKTQLVAKLKELQSTLFKLYIVILHDHLKLNLIYKDFYFRKILINEQNYKNLLKIIQSTVFNKKNKDKDLIDIYSDLRNELLKLNEENKERKTLVNPASYEIVEDDNNIKNVNNDNNNTKKENNIIKEKEDKNEENINNINENINNTLNNLNNNENKIENDKKENSITIINNNIDNNIDNNNNNTDKNNNMDNNNIDNNNNMDNNIDNNSIDELPFLKLEKEFYTQNIFDKIDKKYIINPKKELMKTIFGVYFEHSFFHNNNFEKMKYLYLNQNDYLESNTKLLYFPSKIKNFSNGLEPPYFLKDNKVFFISKIFPITHIYFYDYMKKHNILNESIILIKKNIKEPVNITLLNEKNRKNSNYENNKNEEKNENDEKIDFGDFDCELVKLDRTYFGHIINSVKERFLYFREKEFKIEETDNIKEELEKKVFSLSALELVSTIGAKTAKDNAKNSFLDEDIFPKEELNYNKTVIIFYDDIEEIIERRFLFLWQGVEIFLKNGKSYIFNMLTYDNYNNLIKPLKNIKNVLFREKDFFSKTPIISENWREEKLNTYEYLLFINKYSSRSLNDTSQYYVFPWIIINFEHLIEINEKESEIYKNFLKKKKERQEEIQEEAINNNQEPEINEEFNRLSTFRIMENSSSFSKDFRNLKYPVSVQTEKNKGNKLAKYNDEDDKFRHHHGTHYSTSSYIYYYLMRIEPFTTLLVELQNYCQENPDRMMQDLKDTLKIIKSGNDNRELIPEFFSKIDFFVNINCALYGHKKNKKLVDDVNRIWEDNNKNIYNNLSIYSKFIIEHKKLLNSRIISLGINKWIDNVFGVGQLPPEKKREDSLNIFGKTSYEEIQDLHHKLDKIIAKEKDKNRIIKKKIANRINLIISFGQTPQKIFNEKHKGRIEKNELQKEEDTTPDNYGHKNEEDIDLLQDDDYLGDDFISNLQINIIKRENNKEKIKIMGIYFEVIPSTGKLFILSESCQLFIINYNFYNHKEQSKYDWEEIGQYKLPYICLFDKVKKKYNNNHNVKYAFSSFPVDIDFANSNFSKSCLYSNQYINNTNDDIMVETFKFITCRHLDNSFKLHIGYNKKQKPLETYSYICEDFVMSCRVISSNSFIIGLKNGKLIKALIYEYNPKEKNKKKKKEKENLNDKYKIIFSNYIQGHLGSINMIEIDQRFGIVITSGEDHKLLIRKLYDFELLTSITIKNKYIVTMAKISPMNFMYIICYNKINQKYVIFGYTLSGLKFAKSSYSYYTNIEFTENGNIISLINEKELGILYGHNLNKITINIKDPDYEKYKNVKQSIKNGKWIQYNDFQKYYGFQRKVLSYLSIEQDDQKKQTQKCYFNTLKVSNISYFQ